DEPDEPLFVWRSSLQLVTFVNSAYALEQRLVLRDRRFVCCECRLHLLLDLPELRRREIRTPQAVVGPDTIQGLTFALEGKYGVLEGRRFAVRCDCIDFL